MKANEVRELSSEEIAQRISDEKDQLSQLRFQHAVAELPNPILIRHKRRFIARLSGILTERAAAQ
jgi:large subunit ribosomal protein L29